MNKDNLRLWQRLAKNEINQIAKKEDHALIAVNACVGSGKTTVAMEAMADFINFHATELTLQVFVCPRLALCNQQKNEIDKYLENKVTAATFLYNCEDKKPTDLHEHNQHVILIACDKSIWDNQLPRKLLESRVCGVIAYDESHNYQNHRHQMLGWKDDENEKVDTSSGFAQYFHINLFMSGTPHDYQKRIAKEHHSIGLSIKEALDAGYICKPTLNLVKTEEIEYFDETHLRDAILAIKDKEVERFKNIENMQPRILICVNSIDTIQNLKNEFKNDVHLICIHSVKDGNVENEAVKFEPTIDGTKSDKDEVMDLLAGIEEGTADILKDKKPIILMQVDMISEGVNISSFTSVLITYNAERNEGQGRQTKQMQQIGRVLRKYTKGSFNKYESELANIYVPISNKDGIARLLCDLENNELTEDCFNWGQICDVLKSSGVEDSGIPSEMVQWNSVDLEYSIEEIYKMRDDLRNKEISEKLKKDNFNFQLSKDLQKRLITFLYRKEISKKERIANSPSKEKSFTTVAKGKKEKKEKDMEINWGRLLSAFYWKIRINETTSNKYLRERNMAGFIDSFSNIGKNNAETIVSIFSEIGYKL